MVYKIGLLGTHGVRKTNLTYDIAANLHGFTVHIIHEIATLARNRGYPIDRETTLAAQGWILSRQCAAELEAEMLQYDVAICDRTVFDNLQYLYHKVGNDSHYTKLAFGHAETHPYQALYYLPPSPEFNTKKRDSDQEFRREMDRLILTFVDTYLPQCVKLPLEKRDEWTNIIVTRTIKDLRGE